MAAGGGGGGGGLSAEQLQRMEENRRRARERLAGKRTTTQLQNSVPLLARDIGPPPVKRQALTSTGGGAHRRKVNVQAGSTSLFQALDHTTVPLSCDPHLKQPVQVSFVDRTSSGCTSFQAHSSVIMPPSFQPKSNFPQPLISTFSLPFTHKNSTEGSIGTARSDSQGSQDRPSSSKSTVYQANRPFHSSPARRGAVPPGSLPQPKFAEMRRVIKATLMLTSKTKFKILVPYDLSVIEILKRMPTKSYDAKTATWSFGIEDYGKLVEAIQKECKYVQLNLVPRAVMNLFQQARRGKGKAGEREGERPVDWSRVDSKLVSTLMQFQKEGVEYCIRRSGRMLLADDMGLGKTLQAIAVMTYYRSDWPLLVVCPSSVRLTWAEAFKRWVPSLSEEDINVILTSKGSGTKGAVSIISYDLLVKMAKELQEKKFKAVIADESHFLKNYKTARCKAAMPIIKGATRALLLSGTPALSRPIELYTQITALDKSFRISLIDFGLRYCNGAKNHFGWDFSGASNMRELQMYLEEQIMIRRMKSEVLDQLPTKQRQMVLLDPSLTKGKSKEWKEMKQDLDRAGTLKALDRKGALLPLFNKTGRLKIPAIRDYILDLLEGDRKLIVFGHHKEVLDAVSESLDNKKYEYIRIDGRTPAELRQLYCDRFQHDEKCLVAVLSITTANAGLTLTAASTVVFAELFWNPGILVQAEDRAYRIGQKNSVNIHYLVARDTADDFIWPLVQSKLDVLSQAGLAKDDFSNADSKILKDMTQKSLLECFDDLSDTDLGEQMGSEETSAPMPKLESEEQISGTVIHSAPLEDKEEEEDQDFKETQKFSTRGQQQSGREKTSKSQTETKTQSATDSRHTANTKEGESSLATKSGPRKQLSGTGTISSLAQYLVKASKSNEESSHETSSNTRTVKSVDGGGGDSQGTEAAELEEDGSEDWFGHFGDHDLDDFGNFQDEDYG